MRGYNLVGSKRGREGLVQVEDMGASHHEFLEEVGYCTLFNESGEDGVSDVECLSAFCVFFLVV
jgi:hypothetical protein